MRKIAVTQRVDILEAAHERRDALDQRWALFLAECEIAPVLIPNHRRTARALIRLHRPDGILLTGGNTPAAYGGDAPERDEVEHDLLDYALSRNLPLLGVCRGAQVIMSYFGTRLETVENHVSADHTISVDGILRTVNSFHRYGAKVLSGPLDTWATSGDMVIEAVRHKTKPCVGIMWHPERCDPFVNTDLRLFRTLFHAGASSSASPEFTGSGFSFKQENEHQGDTSCRNDSHE